VEKNLQVIIAAMETEQLPDYRLDKIIEFVSYRNRRFRFHTKMCVRKHDRKVCKTEYGKVRERAKSKAKGAGKNSHSYASLTRLEKFA
jgi:hypothetical protein